VTHSCRISAVQVQTVTTLRRLGGDPLLGLAVTDVEQAIVAELGSVRIAAEIGDVQHPSLIAAQAIAVGDLQQVASGKAGSQLLRLRSLWRQAVGARNSAVGAELGLVFPFWRA
jgi:hypothetical protein